MTIYRSWSDMGQLLDDLMTREWGGVVAEAAVGAGEGDAVEQVVGTALRTIRALRENELFVRIVELDPQLLLPYLLTRRGRSQQAIAELTSGRLREGQQDGSVRDGDPVAIARALLLATHGFVLSAHTMVDDQVDEEDLDHELEHLVRSVVS